MQLLQARGIGKSFPGVRALHSVDLHVDRGEVLALIGENGAGKSTLMKILAGIQLPDEGEISVDGTPVHIDSPRRATELGIALIHQELNLCDNLSVAANIFLGREERTDAALWTCPQLSEAPAKRWSRLASTSIPLLFRRCLSPSNKW